MRLIDADKLEYKVMAMGSPDFEHEVEICDDCAMAFIDLIHKEETVEPDMHNKFTKEELLEIQKVILENAPFRVTVNYEILNNALRKIEEELWGVKEQEN